ncbi:winged helix-turn-helix domain-containing protein [Streptomyces sp. BPTC-684]|uniref:GntR family transcriptional regulator n=1 Tax=Streptomyces sp. BPTC-684 TaxID=3043734 RepID=UPI0024B13A88|nr:winged helix-turn-helix domain-containing protein [Streptomyces sp. BPTC-684]WHM36244.1 winged helix-turn-helix domain-containing protein [Streptomyces sp. BPTC-684]
MATPEVDHGSPTPVYRQIAAAVIADIESGALAVDRRIPSEASLVQRFGVARETVRNAVRFLRDEGYVYTVPQRGTYVRDRNTEDEHQGDE